MRYADREAQETFLGRENFDRPLELLEESFRSAGLNVEFVCAVAVHGEKIVSIYLDGFLQRQQSIDYDNPACAVKDVAAGVRL
jgi:hypothetical protein